MTITGYISPLPPDISLEADWATTKVLAPAIGPSPIFGCPSSQAYMQASGVWADAPAGTAPMHHRFVNGEILSGGILYQPERTNILLHSDDISNAIWTKNSLTPSLAAGLAPNGGNAIRLTASVDGAPTFHRFYQTINVVEDEPYCVSMFVNPEAHNEVALYTTTDLVATVVFNFDDERYENVNGATKVWMYKLPDGWWFLGARIVATGVAGLTSQIQWWMSGGGGNYQGNGETVLIKWPQVELGETPTTPIVSAATAVTRAATEIYWDSTDFDDIYDVISGMVIVETQTDDLVKDVEYLRIDDDSTQNEFVLSRLPNGNFNARIKSSGDVEMDTSFAHSFNDNEPVTCGISYKEENIVASIKGQLLSPTTTGILPFEPSRLVLGSTNFNGTIGKIIVYKGQSRTFSEFRDLTGNYSFFYPDDVDDLNNSYTDVQAITVSHTEAKLQRTHGDPGSYYGRAAPGSRVRIQTTVPDVKFLFEFDDPQPLSYNGVFSVLVNGVEQDERPIPDGSGTIYIEVVGTGSRLVEVVMPIGSSWKFKGIQRFGSGTITSPAARPSKTLICYGDSITNGYFASKASKSWPYRLALLQSAELINIGYGSETSAAAVAHSLGTEAGLLAAEITIYCIGYNDFAAQVPLATYKANVQQFVDDFRAEHPTGKLYLGGPFYTANTNTLTPAMYRTQIADIVTAEADANTILLDTLNAATNAATHWPDGVHGNNLGNEEISVSFNVEINA
jgi:lysophospholipase L1-like esterase